MHIVVDKMKSFGVNYFKHNCKVCLLFVLTIIDLCCSVNGVSELYNNSTLKEHATTYHNKFSIDELLSSKYDYKISEDIDMDPCKSGNFHKQAYTNL